MTTCERCLDCTGPATDGHLCRYHDAMERGNIAATLASVLLHVRRMLADPTASDDDRARALVREAEIGDWRRQLLGHS